MRVRYRDDEGSRPGSEAVDERRRWFRSSTAQHRLGQQVSPGKRPVTFTESWESSSRWGRQTDRPIESRSGAASQSH